MTNMYIYLYMARYHFLAHVLYTVVIKFGFLGMAIFMNNLCMLQAETYMQFVTMAPFYSSDHNSSVFSGMDGWWQN